MKFYKYFQLLIFPLLLILYIVTYPDYLKNIEGNSFYTFTPDFMEYVFGQPACISEFLGRFLSQFYRIVWMGAFIQSLFVLAVLLCADKVLTHIGATSYRGMAFIPAAIVALGELSSMVLSLSCVFFSLMLVCCILLENRKLRNISYILFGIIGLCFMPGSMLAVLFLSLLLYALLRKEKYDMAVICGVLVLIYFIPRIWSSQIAFIPSDEFFKFDEHPILNKSVYYVFASILPIGFLLSKLPPIKTWMSYSMATLVMSYSLWSLATNKIYLSEENFYRYENLASEGKWNDLKKELPSSSVYGDAICLAYALLAESESGTLPDNLFKYPVNSKTKFFFEHDYSAFSCFFNQLFYKQFGLIDECFHLSFQEGVSRNCGMSFRSMRNMIDYALEIEDVPLADKYINLLSHSDFHDSWLAHRKEILYALKKSTAKSKNSSFANRSNVFIGLKPIKSELAGILEQDYNNKPALDYLLCILLLEKNMNLFWEVINHYPLYKDTDKLPSLYADALCLFLKESPQVREHFVISDETIDKFNDFGMLCSNKEMSKLSSMYRNSYWYYYLYGDYQLSVPTNK